MTMSTLVAVLPLQHATCQLSCAQLLSITTTSAVAVAAALLQYRCSCCNASHALAIQRSVAPLLADEELGLACKAGLVALACRLCDPQVRLAHFEAQNLHMLRLCSKGF